jgi:hypothetical protein
MKAANEAIMRQLRPRTDHLRIVTLFFLPLMFTLSIWGMKKTAVLSICSKPTKNNEPVAFRMKIEMIVASVKEIAVEKKAMSRIRSGKFLFQLF